MAQVFGVDISEWQDGISISRLKNEGVKFVIARCGATGSSSQQPFTDSCWEQFYRDCKNAGMPVGAYYYSSAHSTSKAREEANYVLNLLKNKQLEYPIWYDVEDSTHVSMSSNNPSELANIINTFCSTVEAAGYYVGVYSWPWLISACGSKLNRYDRWLADWSSTRPSMSHGMWQFGGSTNQIRSTMLDGITVDQDYAYLDYPSVIKNAGLNGFKKSTNTNSNTNTNTKKETSTMTPQQKVIQKALSQVGYVASPGKHTKYAQALDRMGDVYNGPKDGYDWCDVFADWCYIDTFGKDTAVKMINQPLHGYGAGCWMSAGYYRANGQWSSSPSDAAQIFFGSYGDEGHTGIVSGYDSTYVHTVEGNTGYSEGYGSGAVLKRTYRRDNPNIAGYGVPNWSIVGGKYSATSSNKLDVDGSFGRLTCTALQEALIKAGYNDSPADGVFGSGTTRGLQKFLRSKGYTDSPVDGDCGPGTVKMLQSFLRSKGYTDSSVDGDWGSGTTRALQKCLNAGEFK